MYASTQGLLGPLAATGPVEYVSGIGKPLVATAVKQYDGLRKNGANLQPKNEKPPVDG